MISILQSSASGPQTPQPLSGESFSQLRGRLSSATLEMHQALNSMMAMVEGQLHELQALREQLRLSESALRVSTPQASPVLAMSPSMAAMPTPPLSAMPPFRALTQPLQPQASAAPVSMRLPSGPMMTQILWPTKAANGAAESPEPPPLTTPPSAVFQLPPAQPSQKQGSSALESMLATPHPSEGANLEQSTLEELNAALAYAFSQVSSSQPMENGSLTQMMPSPIPTSALRYGQMAGSR